MSLYCCKFICWCLEYSSCCDYLLCCHCVLCLPATVTCPLIVHEASVCIKSFSNSYTAGSPCPCAWHQESATHRYVLAAFLCSIAEHEVATITLTIANTVYGTMVCRPNCIRLCMTMYCMHILFSCDPKLLIAHINILSHIFQPV